MDPSRNVDCGGFRRHPSRNLVLGGFLGKSLICRFLEAWPLETALRVGSSWKVSILMVLEERALEKSLSRRLAVNFHEKQGFEATLGLVSGSGTE